MSDLRQAAAAALEALEILDTVMQRSQRTESAITALKQALAEPEQPVAWMDIDEHGQRHGLRYYSDGNMDEVPLYTSAPTPQPLTDEEIMQEKPLCADFVSFRSGIRCMERIFRARNMK